jgi:hypothetical protein
VNLKRVAGHNLTMMTLAIIFYSSSVLLLSSLANTEIADAQKDVIGASKASSGNQSQGKNGTSTVETYIVTLKDQNSSADLRTDETERRKCNSCLYSFHKRFLGSDNGR